jgi:hypothetical protein
MLRRAPPLLFVAAASLVAVGCAAPTQEIPPRASEPPPPPAALATETGSLPATERELHVVDLFKEVEGYEATLQALVPTPKPPVTPGIAKKTPSVGPAGPVSSSNCETACVAFRSLIRATDALCRLAGEPDSRCVGARGKVSAAEQRLRGGACACASR